ncbi:MAG TPA: metallophosphoesterase family protein [Gemmataceae bacterium]|nr:metallophosphoesterase family protein [Gemmataceae bacterium]
MTSGRTGPRCLAVGDIHGSFKALTTLAAFVPFRPEDVLVTLGDYVDCGPESAAVLDWLINWQQRGQLVALRGNHEWMMLQARRSNDALKEWLYCGGDKTLASYSPRKDVGSLADVPEAHWRFLDEETRGWYEMETHFFVHANAYPHSPLKDQPDYMLYWEHFDKAAPHESGKVMVCGHSGQRSGKPKNLGHAVCIDTRAYGSGWLTCLDVTTGKYWQANQQGETRTGWLDEL